MRDGQALFCQVGVQLECASAVGPGTSHRGVATCRAVASEICDMPGRRTADLRRAGPSHRVPGSVGAEAGCIHRRRVQGRGAPGCTHRGSQPPPHDSPRPECQHALDPLAVRGRSVPFVPGHVGRRDVRPPFVLVLPILPSRHMLKHAAPASRIAVGGARYRRLFRSFAQRATAPCPPSERVAGRSASA